MHTNALFRLVLLLGLINSGPVLAQAPSASLDWIEVTQAIQDLNNSVPLVAGKKTMIRAYLTLSTGPPLKLLNGGKLLVYPSNGPPITIISINSPALTSQSQIKPKRLSLDATLNFILDPDDPSLPQFSSGQYHLAVENSLLDDGGMHQGGISWNIPCTNCSTQRPMTLLQSPKLKVMLVPVIF